MDLSIKPVESKIKNKIRIPPIQKQNIIPQFGKASSIMIVGSSGSGKTTLLTQLVSDRRFYGDFFKREDRYLFSETAKLDDLSQQLEIPEGNIFDTSDDNEVIKLLDNFVINRKKKIKHSKKLTPTLIIFEDFSSRKKVMNSKPFKFLFCAGRHLGIMSIVITHKITVLPRLCRLNCLFWMVFKANNTEIERLADEMCPSNTTKKEFIKKVKFHTKKPHSFFTIMGNCDEEERFRKNLTHIIDMSAALESF